MTVAGRTYDLSREEAKALRDRLADALSERYEFVHTVGNHHPDGRYEVSRRRAESSGHAKVFESFGEVEGLFRSLPAEFTAGDVEHPGLSGGRRHMIVHHFAEHPGFPCEIVRRQPLTGRKTNSADGP